LVFLAVIPACSDRSDPAAPVAGEARVTPPIEARAGDRFVDVTLAAGVGFAHRLVDGKMSNVVESLGSGVAVLDFDGDGKLDFYLAQSGWAAGVTEGTEPRTRETGKLYRNQGDGTFRDVTAGSGLELPGFSIAAVAADYDADGKTDLYVCNYGANWLFHNLGNGRFEEVGRRAGVADPRLSVGATFFDFDGDSVLDLYVANYVEFDPKYAFFFQPDVFPPPLAYPAQPDALYRGRGDGTFEDVSAKSGIAATASRGMSVVAADFDADGRTDVFVSNDGTPNFLWKNRGDGTFENVAAIAGVAFAMNGDAASAMTADWGDCNGDGLPDLIVTDISYGSLYEGVRPGQFADRVFASGIAAIAGQYASWGGGFLDFDDDGDLDLLVVNGDLHHMVGWEDLLLENDGTGHFSNAADDGGAYFAAKLLGRAGVVADFDDDGDQDALITNVADRPVLLRNESKAGNSWLTLALDDTSKNRLAYGAKAVVRHGGRAQVAELRCPSTYISSGDPRLHFGLGDSARVDELEITWPDGERQVLRDVEARRSLVVRRSKP
jgi:hypothetical protein